MVNDSRTMLVVGHPGHELHLHRWMEIERPLVFVLTDGSGGAGRSRLNHSRQCLARVGAAGGAVFGSLSDKEWYAAILAGDPAPFVAAGDVLWRTGAERRVETIVSDAPDGYNPMHDAAFDLAALAVEGLALAGRRVNHLVVPATGEQQTPLVREVVLNDEALARKETSLALYAPLEREIEQLRGEGANIAVERLYAVAPACRSDGAPHYEVVGKTRAACGAYASVIEARAHYEPLMKAVRTRLMEKWSAETARAGIPEHA
jgi:hypothetical protein